MQLARSGSWFLELVFPLSCSFTSTAPHPSLQNQSCSGGERSQAEPDPEHPQEQSLAFRLGFSRHLLSATPAAAAGPLYLSFFFFCCAPNTLIKQHKAPAELAAPGRLWERGCWVSAPQTAPGEPSPAGLAQPPPEQTAPATGPGPQCWDTSGFYSLLLSVYPSAIRRILIKAALASNCNPASTHLAKRDIKHESECPLERQASRCSGIVWLLLRSL